MEKGCAKGMYGWMGKFERGRMRRNVCTTRNKIVVTSSEKEIEGRCAQFFEYATFLKVFVHILH